LHAPNPVRLRYTVTFWIQLFYYQKLLNSPKYVIFFFVFSKENEREVEKKRLGYGVKDLPCILIYMKKLKFCSIIYDALIKCWFLIYRWNGRYFKWKKSCFS
jgi:hypothetical protein